MAYAGGKSGFGKPFVACLVQQKGDTEEASEILMKALGTEDSFHPGAKRFMKGQGGSGHWDLKTKVGLFRIPRNVCGALYQASAGSGGTLGGPAKFCTKEKGSCQVAKHGLPSTVRANVPGSSICVEVGRTSSNKAYDTHFLPSDRLSDSQLEILHDKKGSAFSPGVWFFMIDDWNTCVPKTLKASRRSFPLEEANEYEDLSEEEELRPPARAHRGNLKQAPPSPSPSPSPTFEVPQAVRGLGTPTNRPRDTSGLPASGGTSTSRRLSSSSTRANQGAFLPRVAPDRDPMTLENEERIVQLESDLRRVAERLADVADDVSANHEALRDRIEALEAQSEHVSNQMPNLRASIRNASFGIHERNQLDDLEREMNDPSGKVAHVSARLEREVARANEGSNLN
eukprot:CAMPEP_0194039326 /NCGR_PEP_ID=MMETSP0009_2-20130614/11474_1 /TAXON_ID=210454 /ORGANISM="Grammatophora oceanica, Strain CCMP 410" /LENGTH=398 /DNA_ID=CAMNT_0038682141 /DNA_START=215 /DNA_END=1408 /DNA_ORIENTATION=-